MFSCGYTFFPSFTFLLLSLQILTTTSQKLMKFPLSDCSKVDLNLLVVTDALSRLDCVDPEVVTNFFTQINDLFTTQINESSSQDRINFVSYSSSASLKFTFFENGMNSVKKIMNSAKITNCTKTYYNRQPKDASILPIVNFLISHFSTKVDEQENNTNVAILVFTGPNSQAVEDVEKMQKRTSKLQNDIKIFVILVDFEEEVEKISYIPDTVHVPSFDELLDNQHLMMSICKKCKQGWFIFEHQTSLNLISCYFLDIDEGRTNDWFSASSRCETIGANLTSVETEDELEFLEKKLHEEIIKTYSSGDVNIFIGLKREHKTMAKRFRWLSGNPVVVSHWAKTYPNGGAIQECGIWAHEELRITSEQNYTELDFSVNSSHYKNGWKDIGCGVPISKAVLCEDVLLSLSNNEIILEIGPANISSILSSIMKGEFTEYQGKIVSIPANAENEDFYSSFTETNSEFELFDCEESEGRDVFISYSLVCDHLKHCSNGRDESICLYRQCDPDTEYECRSHQCVPLEARCDTFFDCFDESDEEHCLECKQRRCCEGTCIPKHWFYDNEIDCSGCSDNYWYLDDNFRVNDEEPCPFICNRTSCVSPDLLGNGIVDCTGPEGPLDEILGKLERAETCFTKSGDVMWAPRCVYVKDRYDSVLGCRDMSHLWNCQNFTCPENYIKCPESYCIPAYFVQDGKKDCPFGEDELELINHTCAGNFACYNSRVCLHPDLMCDGYPQCASRDDELNCHTTCAVGFTCISGTVTVKDYNKKIPLQNLTFVDPRTRYLDLSGIDVSKAILEDATKLTNLLILRLSECKISSIDGVFSSGISNLRSIKNVDLSYNLLRKISKNNMFRYMFNLRKLDLSYNKKLTVLEDKVFLVYYGTSLLEELDLHNTGISSLRSTILEGLNNLKILNLNNTYITKLLPDSFPEDFQLQVLDLRENSITVYDTNSFNGLSIQNHLFTESFGLCCPQIRGTGIPEYTCHAPEDTISSCSHLVREDFQRILLWLVGFVAVLTNSTVIICRVVLHRGVLRKPYEIFVTNLGISDLIMGVYLLIIACADLYFKDNYVLNGNIWKESPPCLTAGFLSTLSNITSAFFILLVTLDRYLVMKFPFGQYSFSKRSMFAASALAWIAGFVLAILPLLPIFSDWTVYSSNGMCLGLLLNADRRAGWRYSASIFVALNSFIFVFIVAGQFSIYKAMSDNRTVKSAAQNSNRRAQDVAVAKQLSLVVLSNFLCWFPIGLMGILALAGIELGKNAYTWAAVLVLPINSAINPLLYTVPVLQEKLKQLIASYSKHKCQKEQGKKNEVDQKACSVAPYGDITGV